MSFLFEIEDVPVKTTRWVQERFQQKRGGWIYGATGSGKSHAVRAAGLGGASIHVAPGPLLGQRFASDLARQLGADGRPLLEVARSEGLAAALAVAEGAVNGHPLVVDEAEQLLVEPVNLDEPATVLWQDDKIAIRNWLIERIERSPTFLISRWSAGDEPALYKHHAPVGWPIKLQHASDGYRPWPLLAALAKKNPAALILARALVLRTSASDFNALIYEADTDEANVTMLCQRLGQAFRSSVPKSWQRVLALLDAVGEVPRDAVEAALAGRSGGESEACEPIADDTLLTLHRLQQLRLVEERRGGLSVLPALSAFGAIRPLTDVERSGLVPSIAHHLLAPINNVRSLEPEHADRVIRAHSIFVEVGDMSNAERTAVLHVHGLVDLARRTSLNERFSDAWQQYDSVLRLLGSGEFGVKDRAGKQLLSYVRHYRAWNGARAGALDDAACLPDYQQALDGWPENALWHQRVIQSLVRLGRLVDARQAVIFAYDHVEQQHQRCDELLRVRPAWTALAVNALAFSLELIEPLLDVSPDHFPEVADGRDALLQRWLHGLAFEELSFRSDGSGGEHSVKLLQPIEVRVRRIASGWCAQVRSPSMEGRAEGPLGAVEALARGLADEVRRLVGAPTSDLSDKDARRKGLLLSFVDALNSDIGLAHARERWIVGRFEDRKLIPTMRHLPPVEVPPELMPATLEGLYFARVPVHRDGIPSGPAEALKPAGNGFGFRDLVKQLERMNEEAA